MVPFLPKPANWGSALKPTTSVDDVSVTIKKIDDLTRSEIQRWRALLGQGGALDHPQLQPEWAQIVAMAGFPVEIAVLQGESDFFGIFPFARYRSGFATPIGGPLTDYHAILASSESQLDIRQLMKACRLKVWTFDHVPASSPWLAPYRLGIDHGFWVDIPSGFDDYWAQQKQRHSKWCDQMTRKLSKLAREVGEVRFELHETSEKVLQELVQWKQQSLRKAGLRDIFAAPNTQSLLRMTASHHGSHFSGWLSALYAGRTRVAVHLGQRSGSVLNAWIPSYHPAYAKYSPGSLLHIELLRACAGQAITQIDLGRGENQLKITLATRQSQMAIGAIDDRTLLKLPRRANALFRNWLRNSDWGGRLRKIYRNMRTK
jgi:CelD/BcsL family acetyltransferase involved in cellulose biosynthesis